MAKATLPPSTGSITSTTGNSQVEVVKRSKCPITREQFAQHAKPIRCTLHLDGVGDRDVVLVPFTFAKGKGNPGGSMGFRVPGNDAKVVNVIDGEQCKLQLNFQCQIVGSNQIPE
jgi:hypothetical protein